MSITPSEIKRVRNKTAGVANIYIDSRTAHELCDLAESAAQLAADKRELVEMLGEVLFRADMGTYTDIEDRALALIAKHKES